MRRDREPGAQKIFMLDQIAVALEVWDFNAEAQTFFAACGIEPYKHALWREP